MSKALTTKEAMQALLDGKKIRMSSWTQSEYIYVAPGGNLRKNDGTETYFEPSLYYYYLYEEPKPKKQVWQWRYEHKPGLGFVLGNRLLSEEGARWEYESEYRYEKHAGPFEVEE